MFVDAFCTLKVNYVINLMKKKIKKNEKISMSASNISSLINIKAFITCFNSVCKQLYNMNEIVRLDRLSDLLFNKHTIYNITIIS